MVEEKKGLKNVKPLRVDPSFKYEVLGSHGGETLKYCFQCGTCTASCPIIRAAGDAYIARKIIKMTILGLKERVLSSDALWYCATCFTCTERCPQGVDLTDVLTVLKNLAVKEGYVPKALRIIGSNIARSGFAFEITEDQETWRDFMNLPPLSKADMGQVSKILKNTSLQKVLEVSREASQ